MVVFNDKSRASYSKLRYGPLLDKICEQSIQEDKKIWNYYEIDDDILCIYYYKQDTDEIIKIITDKEFQYLVYDYYWQLNVNGYPMTRTKGKKQYLHHIVMNTIDIIDHISGNVLDNRKINLRLTTGSLNNLNRHHTSSNTSGTIGVCWIDERQKWRARITYQTKQKNAYFDSLEQAIECRKNWEKEIFEGYYGKFND